MKKVLFVSSESVPFIKTGGLADVVDHYQNILIRTNTMYVLCFQSICA